MTTSSPIFVPSSLGTNATFELRPSTWKSAVVMSAPEDLVDVADRDAGGDRLLDVLDHARAVQRLGDDRVVLAGRDRVLELLDLVGRVQVGVEDGQLGVAGGRRGLGGGEHRRVVAVGDREREVGDLERLVVDRVDGLAAGSLAAGGTGRGARPARWPRAWVAAGAAGPLQAASERRPPHRESRRPARWHDPNRTRAHVVLLHVVAQPRCPRSVQSQ